MSDSEERLDYLDFLEKCGVVSKEYYQDFLEHRGQRSRDSFVEAFDTLNLEGSTAICISVSKGAPEPSSGDMCYTGATDTYQFLEVLDATHRTVWTDGNGLYFAWDDQEEHLDTLDLPMELAQRFWDRLVASEPSALPWSALPSGKREALRDALCYALNMGDTE